MKNEPIKETKEENIVTPMEKNKEEKIENQEQETYNEIAEEIGEPIEDDGRLMFIALTLLVIISLVLIGLFVLLY